MTRFAGVGSLAVSFLLLVVVAPVEAQVSGANCNNPNYTPTPAGEFIVLCNDPVADGLFTEDGVTGYQYIYDVFLGSGCCGTFMIGGSLGPLGSAGTFNAQESAWYRSGPSGEFPGVWQVWGTLQVTDDGVNSHRVGGFGGGGSPVSSVPGNVWTQTDGAALGDTRTDVWDTTVGHNQTLFGNLQGDPIPWARNNDWHLPSEYGYSTELFIPGFAFGTAGQDPTKGLAWQSLTSTFGGGNVELQHTIRVVSPYEPGSINWYHDRPNSGVVTGPNGPLINLGPTSCPIGDVNCDGFVEIGADILTAFTNFTGPGSFGKDRSTGDVHGPSVATTAVLGHDGDVDVSDILTIFGAFTGPPPDEGSGGGLGGPAEAGDPSIPDLIYDASTGEVTLDADGSSIIGYSLQNATNSFLPAGHTPILAGVTTALTSQLEEAALAPGSGSIGLVFPTGLDLAGLQALLTVNTVSRFLGAPLVPFDLVVVSTTAPPIPEPATAVLSLVGLMGLGLMAWRRRR
ncbi:MAG: PEP-CTERM sorting domain-containing protein [Planctomycetota bacterium]|nr:MAG: PEP-CTERM sorting domain-containing protein [Planctomycetota bacterium]